MELKTTQFYKNIKNLTNSIPNKDNSNLEFIRVQNVIFC
jgi:hypothetical protein